MTEESKLSAEGLEVECNCAWNPDRHADACPVNLRDRLTDAQRLLSQLREELAHHIRLLANALGECIQAAGITAPGAALDGPMLLMFADDLKRHLEESRAALESQQAASVGGEYFSDNEIHQFAFEVGGTNGGEYRLTGDELDEVIAKARQPLSPAGGGVLGWAIGRWHAEVSQRPLVNVHRRALDGTWRQIIQHLGGDPDALCGPSHDELMNAKPQGEVKP